MELYNIPVSARISPIHYGSSMLYDRSDVFRNEFPESTIKKEKTGEKESKKSGQLSLFGTDV